MSNIVSIDNLLFACSVEDLENDESLTLEEHGIAIYRVEDEFFATSDSCTHEKWSLGEEGELDGHEVLCTLHMARFDVRTGAPLCFPATIGLKKYETVVKNGNVFVVQPQS